MDILLFALRLKMGFGLFIKWKIEIRLPQLLLVAGRKMITGRFLSLLQPTLDDWFGIFLELFRMETWSHRLRFQKTNLTKSDKNRFYL